MAIVSLITQRPEREQGVFTVLHAIQTLVDDKLRNTVIQSIESIAALVFPPDWSKIARVKISVRQTRGVLCRGPPRP